MCGANPSSPSKCCLAQVSGGGSNLKPAGYHSGLRSLEPPKSWMCWLAAAAPQVALDGVPVTRGVLCAQLDTGAPGTQYHNVLHVIVIHNTYCDYRSSYSYPCEYVLQLKRSSCIYVDDGDSWYCLASFLMWPSIKLLVIEYLMMLMTHITYDIINFFFYNVLAMAYMDNWLSFWCWLLPWPLKPDVDL